MRALVAACTAGFVAAAAMPLRADPVDVGHAKQLYDEATDAMAAGKYDDAAAYFEAAYKITSDPVLFFKIAGADEKAGKCAVAVEYYRRYLAEAKPEPKFVELTEQRIAACTPGDAGSGSATPSGSGSASASASASGSASESGSGSATEAVSASEAGSDLGSSGSAYAPIGEIRHDDIPWLFVGGALAFVTLGAVLAYSASSTESDIRDLYAGVDNQPVVYNATTAQRYTSLVSTGQRYEYLSWTSFAVAAAFGAAAGVWFYQDYKERRVMVTPTASPQGAGVSATLRF